MTAKNFFATVCNETEFKTRIESDKAFSAKFVNTENEAQLIAPAKAEGYDLEQLNEDELDNVAGGSAVGEKIKQIWNWITS